MSLATWSGAAFILLSLWPVQLVHIHLGRELNHLLIKACEQQGALLSSASWDTGGATSCTHSLLRAAVKGQSTREVMLSSLTCSQGRSPSYLTGQGGLVCALSPSECSLNEGFPCPLLVMFWTHQHYPQDHRVFGSISGDHQVQLHPVKGGSPRVDFQGHVKLSYAYLQKWRFHILPGWRTSVFVHLHNEGKKTYHNTNVFLCSDGISLVPATLGPFLQSQSATCVLWCLRLSLLKGRSLHILLLNFIIFLFYIYPTCEGSINGSRTILWFSHSSPGYMPRLHPLSQESTASGG